ncbi:hypothetical protein [Paenibacillus sp. CMAA1364]
MNNNDKAQQSQLHLTNKGPWVVNNETHISKKRAVSRGRTSSRSKRLKTDMIRNQGKVLFVGPSVEGSDKEYVKVLSGTVYEHKPSFA